VGISSGLAHAQEEMFHLLYATIAIYCKSIPTVVQDGSMDVYRGGLKKSSWLP